MALKDIIAKLLGTEPTSETIANKIRETQDGRAVLLAEIDGLNRSRQEMIGDPKAKERARKRIVEARDEIEDLDAMLPGLQERYREAQAQEAARALARHRAAMVEAFQSLEQSIVAADAANHAAVQTWEAACHDLGHQVVNLNFPILYFGAPLNAETIAHWRREVGAALVPVKAPVALQTPVPRAVIPMSKAGGSLQRAARLAETPLSPKAASRALLRETAREGEVAMQVRRAGYEAPSGAQCVVGDVVAMPAEIAAVAAKNGAVDYYSGDAA
jgi:hypothetical protein